VGYSFTVGILLYRWRHHAPAVPFLVPLVLLVLLLLVPAFSHGNSGFDCVCILAIMPGLVFLASRAQFGTVGRKLSTLSADWSYPMYALHYPMVRAMGLAERKLNLGIFPRLALAILGMTAVIMMSAAFYRYYDVPVRRFLTEYLRRWRLSPVRQP
jgi:peptidoglycan/LPS O-acetylase OafA/YrhL